MAASADLIESELFGHYEGRFTGAQNRLDRPFLNRPRAARCFDEIGDMSMD